MKTIHDIKKEEQDKYTTLFNECGVFWAFSDKQFAENKTPLKEGEKYVSIGAGGYMPNSNVKKFNDGMKEIKKWKAFEIRQSKNLKAEHILYELKNHECFYTGDIEDAISILPYTRKDIQKVYLANREKEMVNL